MLLYSCLIFIQHISRVVSKIVMYINQMLIEIVDVDNGEMESYTGNEWYDYARAKKLRK